LTNLRVQKEKRSPYHQRKTIQKKLDEGDIQGVIDNLTPRMRLFAEEYLHDFNGSAAVVRAGYNTKYPNRVASQLLDHPGIKAAIDQITLQRASKSVLKPDYVVKKITKTIERAEQDGNHGAVLRGCELLARPLGMFIERTEISGPNGDAIKYKEVKDAADAFTSAISGLIERSGEGEIPLIVERRD
jgi:phage terminase small subunit